MKKLCVFDLDGTLVNSVVDIAGAINRSLVKMGMPEHPVDAFYKMVGNGMEKLCYRALPENQKDRLDELVKLYKEDYIKNCAVETYAYDGISEMLKRLGEEGMKIAILSNKPQEQTDVVVEKTLKGIEFCHIIGSGAGFPRKPDPTALNYILEKEGVAQSDVWYVGDSDVDMELAKSAGVDSAGALWGFRGADELKKAGAKKIANDAYELCEILLGE